MVNAIHLPGFRWTLNGDSHWIGELEGRLVIDARPRGESVSSVATIHIDRDPERFEGVLQIAGLIVHRGEYDCLCEAKDAIDEALHRCLRLRGISFKPPVTPAPGGA